MDHEFWHKAWSRSGTPGWQQSAANTALIDHWQADTSPVFVPLCGRSPDLEWLHASGHIVIGIEISETAVRQFFEERSIAYEIEDDGELMVFCADRYRLFVGDYFTLGARQLQGVSRVYDRAALVALPEEKRVLYAQHLQTIVPDSAEIFAVLIDYVQSEMDGPPFSVTPSEVSRHYAERFNIKVLSWHNSAMERRGLMHLTETVYHLTPRAATD